MPKQNTNMMIKAAHYKTDKNTSNRPTTSNTLEIHTRMMMMKMTTAKMTERATTKKSWNWTQSWLQCRQSRPEADSLVDFMVLNSLVSV
jgi:hypothetical protein